MVFFFKQKTAYEMRISDWSSDVCSSDLPHHVSGRDLALEVGVHRIAKVARLRLRDGDPRRVAVEVDVGGADEGEIVLVGNRKDDAPVGVLEDVGKGVLEEIGRAHV